MVNIGTWTQFFVPQFNHCPCNWCVRGCRFTLAVSEIKSNEFLFSVFLQPKFGYLILHMIATSAVSQNWKEKHAVHHFKNVFQELCQISCDLYAWSGCHWMHLHIVLVLSSQLLKTTKKLMHEKDTDSAKFKIRARCFIKGNF